MAMTKKRKEKIEIEIKLKKLNRMEIKMQVEKRGGKEGRQAGKMGERK